MRIILLFYLSCLVCLPATYGSSRLRNMRRLSQREQDVIDFWTSERLSQATAIDLRRVIDPNVVHMHQYKRMPMTDIGSLQNNKGGSLVESNNGALAQNVANPNGTSADGRIIKRDENYGNYTGALAHLTDEELAEQWPDQPHGLAHQNEQIKDIDNITVHKEYWWTAFEDPEFVHNETIVENKRWPAGGNIAQAAGRLFMTFGDRFYSCSGTAINDYGSRDRSLIATAAHCIYDDKDKYFAQHVLFIPNQDDGGWDWANRYCDDDPFGCWVPQFGIVDYEWAHSLFNIEHDYGVWVVPNRGAHAGKGGVDLALEQTLKTVGVDLTHKTRLQDDDWVYAMGYPGFFSPELRYARGPLTIKYNLYWIKKCGLHQGSSGGPLPINPYEDSDLYSVFSYGSGYYDGADFIQVSCGGPKLWANSYCSLVSLAESTDLYDIQSIRDGGIIMTWDGSSCKVPGSCSSDADCDDGIFCNGVEQCVDNKCALGPDDPCGQDERCDKVSSSCLPPCLSDAECDDGIYCNGAEQCLEGKCLDGPRPCMGDSSFCEPITDTCVEAECNADFHCDDGVFCNGQEICVEGECMKGINPCGPDEQCQEIGKQCPLSICHTIPDFNVDDMDEDWCCICLDLCEDEVVVECAPMLFFPIVGMDVPCLMWTLEWNKNTAGPNGFTGIGNGVF